jgi:hypothetical protein
MLVAWLVGLVIASEPARVSMAAGLVYSTYLGGTGDEAGVAFDGITSIAVDPDGNIYVTGTTASTDFPTTPGADRTSGGGLDVFVTKLSPAGAVVYSTYLGGPCDDVARDIAVDAGGNAYVTGRANGGGACFADVTPGVLVAKLSPTGEVLYATVFGGSLDDTSIGHAIAVDAQGRAYVTGVAGADDFPITPGAYRTARCPNVYWFAGDGFVARLSADGGTLEYSTYLCGSGDDSPSDIAIDAAGNAYVAGTTGSTDFPTVDPVQDTFPGGVVSVTGFVSKLGPDGSSLVYSTYLGGSTNDWIGGIAVDGDGNAYVTGQTQSDDFPTTPGVLQDHAGNRFCVDPCSDAFVTKIDASGSALAYSTYLFGELDDGGAAIAVDGDGNAYVVGTTYSINFPILGAFQATDRALADAFVAELDPDGTRLVSSSYLGGGRSGPSPRTGYDQGSAIALDAAGNVYVSGYTQSYDFPTTPDAFQPAIGDGICDSFGTPCGDVFVAKIAPGAPGVVPPVSVKATPGQTRPGGTILGSWAGIPRPTATDDIRLYSLGSSNDYPAHAAASWPLPGTAAGTHFLQLPAGVAPGWYELRLQSPDLVYHLPSIIARSEPILVTGAAPTTTTTSSTTTSTTLASTTTTRPTSTTTMPHPTTTSTSTTVPEPDSTTTTTLPSIARCGGDACDDGDPCTVDSCLPGRGCVSTPAVGLASVTCTCRREEPAACADETLPTSIVRRRARACTLFGDAGGALPPKRLRKGATTLNGSMALVSKARRSGRISSDCADALTAELRDRKDRAERLLGTPGVAGR